MIIGKGVQEFPFRKETFIITPSKAKELLHWHPKHSLATELSGDIAEYKLLGGFDEQWTDDNQLKYDLEVSFRSLCIVFWSA